jgi:hypothetical protein
MQKRISLILFVSSIILLMQGCASSLVPSGYRYNIRELPNQISGNWTDIKIKPSESITEEMVVSGELIAIQSDTIFLLTTVHLEAISISNIKEAVLHMYQRKPGLYAGLTGLLYIPDVVAAIAYDQVGFLLIGLPGLVCGTIVTIVEGNNINILKYPGKNDMDDLVKFSRFPQGMPKGIERSKLHLVSL